MFIFNLDFDVLPITFDKNFMLCSLAESMARFQNIGTPPISYRGGYKGANSGIQRISTSPSLQRLRSSPFTYLQFSGTMTSGADVPNTEKTSGVNVPCSMDITR